MKKLLLCFVVSILVSHLFAQNYSATENGSDIKFSIKNFGFTVSGSFKGLKGKFFFDPANLPTCSISASVEVTTINTDTDSRDRHLKKEEYFDAEKYPRISFVSTKITTSTKAGTLFMEGKITIKGVTKVVSFPFTATPKGDGYLFEGEFKLNRRDFGVGGSSMVMSDNLTVSLSVFAGKSG
ncbi:MAG: YceI family protein [Ferruginibacter sp.]